MVIWVIGLSQSGKTTLGKALCKTWKETEPHVVFVDGDEIRAVFGDDLGPNPYSRDARKKNADRICRLCAWLDKQSFHVVCSILSLFEESREWNRMNCSRYYEVYVTAPMEVLKQRDCKNIYAPALRGERQNVVGVDIPFNPPLQPNFIFDNSNNRTDFSDVAKQILSQALAL